MDKPYTNIQRLEKQGYPIKLISEQGKEIPPEYLDVIEDLRPEEIELIIDVTRRLERARDCVQNDDLLHYKFFVPTF